MDEGSGPAATVFDALGADYERAFGRSAAHHASLRRLLDDLAPHGRVLDVGSGTGRPTAQVLSEAGHEVHGVDVSPVMVEIAARNVPGASFTCADILRLSLEERSFDAACAYFPLLQMARADQSRLLRKLARLLVPGGHLVVATVPLDVEDVDVVFMGQRVRATSFGPEEFTELVTGAGFTVLWEQSTIFTPEYEGASAEPQLFLHCRRA
ncbi:class I SAM-dependent methyltransferase [Streptomyces sp. NPDC092952]|uniref:class I SAM-dependent methyltransferase n=1 Tax=Streptomyces sp. NPDC092952 TaxID=3366018 RepID=UPI003813217F